jgi:hypothetical protein
MRAARHFNKCVITEMEFSVVSAKQSEWCNSHTILPTVTENGVNNIEFLEL